MGNITFLTPCGNQFVTRAYVRGLSLHDPCTNPLLAGQLWTFDSPGGEHWVVRISDEFFPASSNHYSVDHVVDAGASFHYTFGLPTAAFVYLGLCFIPTNQDWYVGLNCLAAQNPTLALPLPMLGGYWRPFS